MSQFQYLKQQLHLEEVVCHYTGQVAVRHKICCPFHSDTHPSLQLKNERFHCFVCAAHGDVIDFTARYFNEPTKAALGRLCQDFGLQLPNLPRQTPAQQSAAAAARRRDRLLRDAFARWETASYGVLSTMHRTARQWRHAHPPKDPETPPDARYLFAISHIDWLRELLDIFSDTTAHKVALYQNDIIREEIYETGRYFEQLAYPCAAASAAKTPHATE